MIVISVRHTGTMFYVWYLSRHPNVKDRPVDKTYDGMEGKGTYANGNVVHSHIGERPGEYDNNLKQWAEENRAVIPLRDPMLSIITHYRRNKKNLLVLLEKLRNSGEFVTDGFKLFSEMDPNKVLFMPVDQYWSVQERFNRLVSLEKHCDIKHDEAWTRSYSNNWHIRNSVGDSEEKKAYLKGNVEAVWQAYPQDVEYLLDNAKIIQPFLEKHGYNNLPWFNWRPSM
jgi:hypothetical protein